MSKYFRSDDKYIYLESEAAEFYIPNSYFEESSKFAENLHTSIKCLGVLNVGIFEGGQIKEFKLLNLPTWIELFVDDIEEDRSVKLPYDDEPTSCTVLKYIKGAKIMSSTLVADSSNVESYMGFILKGKVPHNVPYEKSITLWKKNQEINKASLAVPDVIEEMILSVSYRYKENPSIKFSHIIGKNPNISQYDYVMNNIRQICQYTSTFTAMTFEDIDTMITTSLNRTRNHEQEAYSPIEDILKM